MAQHIIQIPIIEDTYIDMNNPDTNYGSSTELKAGGGNTNPYYPNYRQEILLKWDESSIPARKKVIGKYLCLYAISQLTTQCFFYAVGPTPFSEMTATWNSIKKGTWVEHEIFQAQNVINAYTKLNILNKHWFSNGICELGAEDQQSPTKTLVFASRESSNPPYIEVVYEDVPPDAPTPKSPIGAYKDSKSVIRFEWQYNSGVGGTQKAFDLQWSTDQVNWTTVSQTTANTYYDMPANTLPVGNIYWRVRTYNEYDEVGPYSDIQSFYAIGAPAAPVINAIPSNTARPLVTWNAFDQQIYQLQVLQDDEVIYDSGEQPGINIRQHKIKAWLEDGEYTVQLRIKNEYDLWSEWSSAAVTISTDKPEKPSIALQRSAYGVEIIGTGLVYRSDYDKDDYICIGIASGTYFDNTVRSKVEYKYFIRAVSENDTFKDSDIKFIQAELRHALIAPVSDLSNVFAFTRSLNLPPKRTYNHQPGGAFVEYVGRKHPVWEPTEHVNAAWQMSFYLKAWAEVEAFVALVDRKETVLYRDARGRKVYGILSNLTIDDERSGYIVSFTLTEVDYIEGVDV